MNNTLNRRMFMQQGGVVPSQTMLPPAQTMAPQMMAPPAQTMLPPAQMEAPPAQMMDPSMLPPGATQQVAGDLMEQEGAAITEGIMSQVDSAQDYEELMNAIRGNELPIESRRGELAELVGTPDAEQTPDSVLTLVQPTLSIVDAQGGLDSLMQEQADVVMEDGTGAPTQMAGGLGSMLMAGQPEEPVQMADGGLVRKMANGTPAFLDNPAGSLNPYTNIDSKDFRTMYESMLPTFMEAAGTPDKDLQKTQAYASLAGAGLRLAQGSRQPGATFLGDLAGAFQPVPGELTAIASQGSELETAARLQAAGLSAQMTLEQQKALAELAKGERGQKLDQQFRKTLALFTTEVEFNSQESAQEQQVKMAKLKSGFDQEIARLTGSLNQEDMTLQAALTEQRDVLLEQQRIAAGVVAFNERATEAGVLQAHQIDLQANDAKSAEKNLNTEIFSREGMQLLDLAQRDRALAVQQDNIDKNYKIDGLKLEQAQSQFDTSTALNRDQFGAKLDQARTQFETTTAQRNSLAQAERDFATTMSKLTQEQEIELYELGVLSDTALVDLEYGYKAAIAQIENSLGTGNTRAERQSAILRNNGVMDSWVLGEDNEKTRLYDQALGERVQGQAVVGPSGKVSYPEEAEPLPDFLLQNIANRFRTSENLPANLEKIGGELEAYNRRLSGEPTPEAQGGTGGTGGTYDAELARVTKKYHGPGTADFNVSAVSTNFPARVQQYVARGAEGIAGLSAETFDQELVGYENLLIRLRTLYQNNADVFGAVGEIDAGARGLDTKSLDSFEKDLGWVVDDEGNGRFRLILPEDLGKTLLVGYVAPYKESLRQLNIAIENQEGGSEEEQAVGQFTSVVAQLEAAANYLLDKSPGDDQAAQDSLSKFVN